MFDRIERELAQGLRCFVRGENANALIHADKPLCSSTVDDGCFMAPAMRIAVADAMRSHQTVGIFQRFQNNRNSFPNMLAAKQSKLRGIRAVTLNRVQDIVVLHSVCHARVEVIHTISRCAVDDTGAVICCGVVGQIHRRSACKTSVDMGKWVMEFDQIELLAKRCGDNFAAELPAFQTFLDQTLSTHIQAAFGVDQSVGQLRVEVEGLVGGDGPCGGGPDDCEGFFVQFG